MGVKKVKHYPPCNENPQKTEHSQWRMDIFHEKFDVVSYLLHTTVFNCFWVTLGVKKGQTLLISLKNIPQMSIFALVDLVLREIRWCHSFFDKILYSATLGFSPDVMESKDAYMPLYLFQNKNLFDASALPYSISFMF